LTTRSSEQRIGTLLRYPWQAVRSRIHQALVAAGFDDIQPAHLAVLQTPGPDGRRPTELARAALTSKQAMNRLIQGLERLGYVQRTAAEDDGRARIVRLTERGWQATAIIHKTAAKIERELAAELGADRLEALKRELAELADLTAAWRET
jgi:DNA-binding MarR family transcriptional regulator